MSASPTREVATTTAMTQMKVTVVPAIMPMSGPPEAICGWSGPAVGGEVVEIKLAREARGKFWT